MEIYIFVLTNNIMKTKLLLFVLITNCTMGQEIKTFFDFTAKTITGENLDLSHFKGKKVLVVNTASKCGFTPQYAQLEELYKKYSGDKFAIIGFPANNFMKQEPGTNEEIKEFCTKNYGVTFPMMQKISVKGDDIDPIYSWLTLKEQNGVEDAEVKWNFQKYLIDENGKWVGVLSPKVSPDSDVIVHWITRGTLDNTSK